VRKTKKGRRKEDERKREREKAGRESLNFPITQPRCATTSAAPPRTTTLNRARGRGSERRERKTNMHPSPTTQSQIQLETQSNGPPKEPKKQKPKEKSGNTYTNISTIPNPASSAGGTETTNVCSTFGNPLSSQSTLEMTEVPPCTSVSIVWSWRSILIMGPPSKDTWVVIRPIQRGAMKRIPVPERRREEELVSFLLRMGVEKDGGGMEGRV